MPLPRHLGRRVAACVVVIFLIALAGGSRAHDIWFGDGVRIVSPVDLTAQGTARVRIRQPVLKQVGLELSFLVPRAEWAGLPLPDDGPRGPRLVPVPGLTLEYVLGVRDARGGVVRPSERATRQDFHARLAEARSGIARDLEVVLFLAGFTAERGRDYDVRLDVLKPLSVRRADRARLVFIPVARDALLRFFHWVELLVWLGALSIAVVLLFRVVT